MTQAVQSVQPDIVAEAVSSPRPPWWRRALPHVSLPILVIAFLVIGFRLVPGYRGQMNPDGVSYLTIARQYLGGHFADAVNAYWSPLYSWLLVPFLAVGVEGTLATKILAILIGAGILAIVWWLCRNLGVPRDSRIVVSLTLFPILYYFGMDVTTPDLLVTAMLLLYAAQMTMRSYGRRRWDGAASGALGALAYLAKAYALPVVSAHLVIVATMKLYRARRVRRKRVIIQAVSALLVLGVLSSLWAGALRHKYGYFMFGSTGKFNIAFNGPHFRMPMTMNRLLLPPTPSGTSGWDDATVLPYTPWNPIATPADRAFWENNRARNEREIIAALQKFTWLLWPILLLGVRVAGSSFDPKPRRPGAIFVILLVMYPLGYYLLHVYERFLSIECIGLLVLGVFAVSRLTWPMSVWVRVPLRVACVLVVAWSFLSNSNYDAERDPPRMALGRWSIAKRWGEETRFRQEAAALAGVMPPRAMFASNENWEGGLYIGFHLNLRYAGVTTAVTADQLSQNGVEYYWDWGDANYRFLRGATKISEDAIDNLAIYHLPTVPTTQPAH